MLATTIFIAVSAALVVHADGFSHNEIRNVRKHHKAPAALQKRESFHGVATYYDVEVGKGACGEQTYKDQYTIALNSAQFDESSGYPAKHCFKWVTISGNGKTVGAKIMDECPTCGPGDIDLSEDLFLNFATIDDGVFDAEWWFDGDGGDNGDNGDNNDNNNNDDGSKDVKPEKTTKKHRTKTKTSKAAEPTSSSEASSSVEPTTTSEAPTTSISQAAAVAPTPTSDNNIQSVSDGVRRLAAMIAWAGLGQ